MKKLYIMLDDVVKMAITVDKTVILYKEYLYTESVLDVLYAKVIAHKIDSAVVICKGILSRNTFIESYKIFNFTISGQQYDCYVSKFDVNKILNLLKTAGVNDVRIVDKFGYFVSLNKIKFKNCCMIDNIGNAYVVITFLDKIRDVVYNKYSNLEKILINNNKKYAISKYLDMTTYFDEGLLKYFKNSSTILEKLKNQDDTDYTDPELIHVLSSLSVFAFTELPGSKFFEVDLNKLNLIGANPIKEEDDFSGNDIDSEDDDLDKKLLVSEKMENQEKKDTDEKEINKQGDKKESGKKEFKTDNKKPKNKKTVEKPAPSKALIAANTAAIVASIFCIAGVFYADTVSKSYEERIGQVNDQYESNLSSIDSINESIVGYEQFSQDLENTAPYGTMFSKLVGVNKKMSVTSVAFDGGTMNAQFTVTAKNKKAREKMINKVVENLGKDFTVQSYTTTIDGKNVQFNTYLSELN